MTSKLMPELTALASVAVLSCLCVWSQGNQEQGRPQFTTIPIHNRMVQSELKNGHVVYVPPVAGENFDRAGSKPGQGGGKSGGGKHGGSSAPPDFGQPASVLVAADGFLDSATNFDITRARDSYQGEPALAADPFSGKLVGGQNDIYPGNCSAGASAGSFGDCAVSATVFDMNFVNRQRLKLSRSWGGHDFLISFDPSVGVDSTGRYYLAFGLSDGSTGGPNGIAVVTSADGGASWTKTNPVVINLKGNKFEDKYWIGVDNHSSSPFRDRLYVVWTRNSGNNQSIMVSFSSDGGQSWSNPKQINDGRSKFERVIYAFPAISADGTVNVLWYDYALRQIFLDRSSDGGVSWGTDRVVASTHIGFGVDIGCNGGRSTTPAPQMAVDPNSGTIYVVYADDDPSTTGVDLNVYLTMSADGGASWSTPVRSSSTSAGQQYNPAVAVDGSGNVDVSFLDRRDDPLDCRTQTYLSSLSPAGVLLSDFRTTDVDSDFDGNPNGPGDYAGLAALFSSVYPYFPDHRDSNAVVDDASATIDGGYEIYAAAVPQQ